MLNCGIKHIIDLSINLGKTHCLITLKYFFNACLIAVVSTPTIWEI